MRNKGFTLIEVIVTILVAAIAIIPASLICMKAVQAAAEGDAWTMASNLARRELGIVSALPFTDASLNVGTYSFPGYLGYKYDLTRVVSVVAGTGNLKQVAVNVYPAGSTSKCLELDTYVINNVTTGLGTGGGSVSPEGNYLTASTGTYSNITHTWTITSMTNSSANGAITIMQVSIWRSAGASFNLTSATMDATTVWTGSLTIPTSQPVSPNVVLTASCIIGPSGTVTSNTFVFNASINTGQTIYIKYRMYDGTDSATFSYTR